jgi:Ca2+-transporting ATPase
VPAAAGLIAPFSPIMIILLELFMDLAASAAFVIEPPEKGLMQRPPRRANQPFLDAPAVRSIVTGGIMLSLDILLTVWLLTGWSPLKSELIRSASFAAWMWGHVLLALVFRYMYMPPYYRRFANRILDLWAWGAVATAILVSYVPFLNVVFGTAALSLEQWALIFGIPLGLNIILVFTRTYWQGELN